MDIRDKLEALAGYMTEGREASRPDRAGNLQEYIPGEACENRLGSYYKVVTEKPVAGSHGSVSLGDVRQFIPSIIHTLDPRIVIPDAASSCDILFLDTETTGLAGGAGTVPFLTGIGYFTGESFRVVQYFMRDFSEEQAVLFDLARHVTPNTIFVTYNGKCYDMNILGSRYTMAKIDNPFEGVPHLDLLFPVRRLWKRRIGSCSLIHVEENILDFFRQDDIPGWEIPQRYFEYIRTGDARLIAQVITHNVFDIQSLAAVLLVAARVYRDPVSVLNNWQDFLSMGRIYHTRGEHKKALECFKRSAASSQQKKDRLQALLLLGAMFKKNQDWADAEKVWQYIIEKHPSNMAAREELAKMYEHRNKDYAQAEYVVKQALAYIEMKSELQGLAHVSVTRASFQYRLSRISRKRERKTLYAHSTEETTRPT